MNLILSKMEPDGYWLQKNPGTKKVLGEEVIYGYFATTHFCLAYLAELGLDKTHPKIKKATERYLNLQQKDGDFYKHLSCLYAHNIRNFILLGYKNDKRVHKTIVLMLNTFRSDGGYLCELHEGKYKKRDPEHQNPMDEITIKKVYSLTEALDIKYDLILDNVSLSEEEIITKTNRLFL